MIKTIKSFGLLVTCIITSIIIFEGWILSYQAGSPRPGSYGGHGDPNVAFRGRKNVWADLTPNEATNLVHWLHSSESGLNITESTVAGHYDDLLLVVEILRPNKSDTVNYLDHDGPVPARFARVTVKRNSLPVPDVAEYKVGPLGKESSPGIEALSFPYNSGRSSTTNPDADVAMLSDWLNNIITDIEDILQDLLGPPFEGFPGAGSLTFEANGNDQAWWEDQRLLRWVTFSPISYASTLLPQGLYLKADTTGRDSSQWRIAQWLYNNVSYANTKDLRTAWKTEGFQKTTSNIDGTWTHLEPELLPDTEEYSSNVLPFVIQPGASRISLDLGESYVSWMGFTFNLAFSQVNGVALYDVRLDGERILYELSLQEALAHYAGSDPIQGSTAFLDSLYGLGTQTGELVPGYDCPTYAHFIDLSYHRMEKTYHRAKSLCIFESPTDAPLQRHATRSSVTSFKNSVLIIRTVTVVGNYDYMIDYIMYLDGTIEVKARASGYIQGAYYLNNTEYGYRVHDALSSSIHDHVLNFKADLDIAGGSYNSISNVTIAAKKVQYPWQPMSSGPRQTMVLEKSTIEKEIALDWPHNAASMYIVTGAINQLGERRGYRIMPGTGVGSPAHLTVTDSPILHKAAAWAHHDVFITQQKDTEPRSSSPANALTPKDPLIDFSQFTDNESIIETDIVVWFNLGMHHVPHTGDIPNTLMTTSASSIMFTPHNYHSQDRSRALTDGIHIDLLEKSSLGYKAILFGSKQKQIIFDDFIPSLQPFHKLIKNDSSLAI